MTLPELCEPLFQYLCQLNRAARKADEAAKSDASKPRPRQSRAQLEKSVAPDGARGDLHTLTAESVRQKIKKLLSEIMAKSGSDQALADHLAKDRGKIYLVLLFFADFVIRTSRLPFANDWHDLCAEEQPPELAPNARFFELLDQTLDDNSEAATERISVYYTCMGLGFTGMYGKKTDRLIKKMDQCRLRLGRRVNADQASVICPTEWHRAHVGRIGEPIAVSLVPIAITLVVLLLALFALNVYLYHDTASEISSSLDRLLNGRLALHP